MKKLLLLSIFSALTIQLVYSQTVKPKPAQVLRLARATFEQGRLHELPLLLSDLHEFSQAEKVDAYKLLTQAYIYLEEPEKADQSMLELLRTDHYFEINEAVDPAEFVALYKTFRTKPVYKLGLKIGPNTTFPSVLDNYYVGSDAFGKGKSGQQVGFQFGVVYEKDLFLTSSNSILNKLTIAPELLYVTRSFKYTNSNVFVNDSTGESVGDFASVYKQTWVELSIIMQYALKESRFNPYVGLGPTISYLATATNSNQTLILKAGSTVSGPNLDVTNSYNKIMYSLIGVAGIKVRAGSIYLNAEVRFQYGLTNVINPKKRTNAENVFDYASQFNNFKQSNTAIHIGAIYPIFKPKKL